MNRGGNQKQPSTGILRKRSSENMQQIYRRTPAPKCDFNKVALQLYWNRTLAKLLCNFIEIALRHGCSLVNLLHIFRTTFPRNTSGWLLLCNLLLETPVLIHSWAIHLQSILLGNGNFFKYFLSNVRRKKLWERKLQHFYTFQIPGLSRTVGILL